MLWKIAPETSETVWNEDMCFKSPGFDAMPAEAQDVLPDVSKDYEFMGTDAPENTLCSDLIVCEKWMNMNTFQPGYPDKKANYTLWAHRMADGGIVPVRFDMMGVNIIFGSHFDHYIIDYTVKKLL